MRTEKLLQPDIWTKAVEDFEQKLRGKIDTNMERRDLSRFMYQLNFTNVQTKEDVLKFAKAASKCLKGFGSEKDILQPIMEASAAALGFRNWDHLCGVLPETLSDIPRVPCWHVTARTKVYSTKLEGETADIQEDEEFSFLDRLEKEAETNYLEQEWQITNVAPSNYPWNGPDDILNFRAEIVERSSEGSKPMNIGASIVAVWSVHCATTEEARQRVESLWQKEQAFSNGPGI